MGNAVGPVALICFGIFLGYLALTGRAANLVAVLNGQTGTVASNTLTATTTKGQTIVNQATATYGLQ